MIPAFTGFILLRGKCLGAHLHGTDVAQHGAYSSQQEVRDVQARSDSEGLRRPRGGGSGNGPAPAARPQGPARPLHGASLSPAALMRAALPRSPHRKPRAASRGFPTPRGKSEAHSAAPLPPFFAFCPRVSESLSLSLFACFACFVFAFGFGAGAGAEPPHSLSSFLPSAGERSANRPRPRPPLPTLLVEGGLGVCGRGCSPWLFKHVECVRLLTPK